MKSSSRFDLQNYLESWPGSVAMPIAESGSQTASEYVVENRHDPPFAGPHESSRVSGQNS
jgi:hypothetical protein